jgi:hypothetical protein
VVVFATLGWVTLAFGVGKPGRTCGLWWYETIQGGAPVSALAVVKAGVSLLLLAATVPVGVLDWPFVVELRAEVSVGVAYGSLGMGVPAAVTNPG